MGCSRHNAHITLIELSEVDLRIQIAVNLLEYGPHGVCDILPTFGAVGV